MRLLAALLIFFLAMLILAGAACGAAWYAFNYYGQCADPEGETVVFTVENGERLPDIAERLEAQHLIKSALYMRIIAKLDKTENSFKSGQYNLSAAMTPREIQNLIVAGSGINIKVTIPEGITLNRIASILEEADLAKADEFIAAAHDKELLSKYFITADSAQGYIFPDSYLFQKGLTAKTVLSAMLDTFYAKLNSFCPGWKEFTPEEVYNKVILASIVEREYRLPQEAPLVASVFYNRLEHSIALSSCATVEYIITEIQGKKHPEYITYDDLKIKSP
ncbi:MAG: endolytic transglycosylase MltG, partial [Spirochaetia bacterium]|nr:endolytic transglycosylase MltG [Spirochaetia bacterium]